MLIECFIFAGKSFCPITYRKIRIDSENVFGRLLRLIFRTVEPMGSSQTQMSEKIVRVAFDGFVPGGDRFFVLLGAKIGPCEIVQLINGSNRIQLKGFFKV